MHTMHNDKEGPSSFEVENDKRHISCGNVIYIINDDIEVIKQWQNQCITIYMIWIKLYQTYHDFSTYINRKGGHTNRHMQTTCEI